MSISDIKQWLVESQQARPVNQFTFQPVSLYSGDVNEENYKWAEFEQFVKQHTYATDAPDGIHSDEMFGGVVWQSRLRGFNTEYSNVNPDAYKNSDNDFETYRQYCDDMGAFTRQFLPFKQPILETSLSETLHFVRQVINPNANAIKVIQDRIADINQYKIDAHFADESSNCDNLIIELNYILKLLQS